MRFGELSGLNILMKSFTFPFTLLPRLFSPEGVRELRALGLAADTLLFALLVLCFVSQPRAARGPGRRRRAKHIPIPGGGAPPGRHRLATGEYVPVEFLPELPPPVGARALPEHGPLPRPAPSPAPRSRRGAERRVQRGAPLPQVVVPRRAAGRAAEYVGEVDVGPARAVRCRRLGGHADARLIWSHARGSGK